ncbi:hypothetical protein RB608_15340 [Nocardioides sp. LHD-245]|uniref:hypothetical protein n=1 Tax=Nocardioides sp. LHD-245 TaxID=3051387 RepID=UPI0027E11570|nr:hypothetical protein [Nocardioides sp. LHD-245]
MLCGAEDGYSLPNVPRLCSAIPGVVSTVLTGTGVTSVDHLEEVAFLIWLLDAWVPVAVTASMRPPTAIGSDALPTLVDAAAGSWCARPSARRTAGWLRPRPRCWARGS